MNRENSIIMRLFRVIIASLLIILGLLYFFTTQAYPLTHRFTQTEIIKREIASLVETNYANLNDKHFLNSLNTFSENTQTFNIVVPTSILDKENYLNSPLAYYVSCINSYGKTYYIMLPPLTDYEINAQDKINGSFIKLTNNIYYPKTFQINNLLIYNNTKIDSESIKLNLTAQSTTYPSYEATDENKTMMFSNEYYNYLVNNFHLTQETDYSQIYTSYTTNNADNNIVFLTKINDNNTLISIFEISSITNITDSLGTLSLFFYLIIVIVLMALMNRYFKSISEPLHDIAATCNNISKLNFGVPLPYTNKNDEIGEISTSVNIMSLNLQSALAELEEKNKQISDQIKREKERDALNKDFVAGLSHELKTPLAVIKASTEAIQTGIFEGKDLDEQYDNINREIDRSNQLIKDMIKVYEIETPDYARNFKVFNIKDAIEKVHQSNVILAEANQITVYLDIHDIYVYGDQSKIELVISNLYTNAIKYTNENEFIYINCYDDGLCVFEIINTGITIPESSINNLFEPFYRVNKSRSRKMGSTGLGLYITRQILEQHNADYGVVNLKNAVRFYFSLEIHDK